MKLFRNPNFDFIRWRWHAILFSSLVIIAGLWLVGSRGLPLGIDFSGGTIVVLDFDKPTNEEAVRNALASIPGEEIVQTYGNPADYQILVRLPQQEGVEQGSTLSEGATKIVAAQVRRAGLVGIVGVTRETDVQGEQVQKLVELLYATPKATVERAKELVKP